VATVNSSSFGIGCAIDIEGNCRFYDLLRFKKMAKISAGVSKGDNGHFATSKFRLL